MSPPETLLSRGFLLSFLDSYPLQLQNSSNALGMGAPDLSFVVSHPFFSLGIWLLKSLKLSLQPYKIIRTSAHFSVPRSDPPSGHQILSIIQKSPIVPNKKQLNTSVVLFPLESWLLSIVLTFLSYLKVIFPFFFLFFLNLAILVLSKCWFVVSYPSYPLSLQFICWENWVIPVIYPVTCNFLIVSLWCNFLASWHI